MKEQVEERLNFFDTNERPARNLDVMKELLTDLREKGEYKDGEEKKTMIPEDPMGSVEPEKKKKKKKSKKVEEDEPEAEAEEAPVKKEKKKKKKKAIAAE